MKLLINCYLMLREVIGYEEFRRRGEVGLCEGSGAAWQHGSL